MSLIHLLWVHIAIVLCYSVSIAQPIAINGFVDSYYAFSSNEPPNRVRSFTTQPLYHNAIAINLAMLRASVATPSYRGAFALQTGTFTEANYIGRDAEYRFINEANAGVNIGGSWWIDAGVFHSHIGFESIASRDNFCYTRSIIADYTPYYETGVKLSGKPTEDLTLSGLVLNGWQNIIETNSNKAFGTQVQYQLGQSATVNWSTLFSNEEPDSLPAQYRFWNNIYVVAQPSSSVDMVVGIDIGRQSRPMPNGITADAAMVYSATAILRYTFSPMLRCAVRGEWYADRNDVIVRTGTLNGYQTTSASLTIDYIHSPQLLCRVEGRAFSSRDAVYPSRQSFSNTEFLLVGSMGVSL